MLIFNAKPEVLLDENLMRPLKVFTCTNKIGTVKYIGAGQIEIPDYGPYNVEFEIEAATPVEAYSKYDAAFAAELKRLKSESKKDKIVTPGKEIVIPK